MNQAEEREKSMETANQSPIYMLIAVGVIVSMIGVFLRFAFDSTILSIVSWVILFIGSFICCKAVFKILDAK
jgi:divalent metal cation (Fe/Co/Zn/Cd) transporter